MDHSENEHIIDKIYHCGELFTASEFTRRSELIKALSLKVINPPAYDYVSSYQKKYPEFDNPNPVIDHIISTVSKQRNQLLTPLHRQLLTSPGANRTFYSINSKQNVRLEDISIGFIVRVNSWKQELDGLGPVGGRSEMLGIGQNDLDRICQTPPEKNPLFHLCPLSQKEIDHLSLNQRWQLMANRYHDLSFILSNTGDIQSVKKITDSKIISQNVASMSKYDDVFLSFENGEITAQHITNLLQIATNALMREEFEEYIELGPEVYQAIQSMVQSSNQKHWLKTLALDPKALFDVIFNEKYLLESWQIKTPVDSDNISLVMPFCFIQQVCQKQLKDITDNCNWHRASPAEYKGELIDFNSMPIVELLARCGILADGSLSCHHYKTYDQLANDRIFPHTYRYLHEALAAWKIVFKHIGTEEENLLYIASTVQQAMNKNSNGYRLSFSAFARHSFPHSQNAEERLALLMGISVRALQMMDQAAQLF